MAKVDDPITSLVSDVQNNVAPKPGDVLAITQLLGTWLSRRRLDPSDQEEVCADAVMRLIRVAKTQQLDPTKPAGAWLRVVADHLAIDALRRSQRTSGLVDFDDNALVGRRGDDDLAAMLDADAAASDVRRALRAAVDAGQSDVVRSISAWLFLAEANGEAPTTREVAERLGVSHMTIQRALKSFGARLAG